MNSYKPIGGFFELELDAQDNDYFKDAILLNNGRNCLEYVIRANGIDRVFIPQFTCDVMLEPLERLGVLYERYAIDENMEIVEDLQLKDNELLLYTNYFGVKDEYSNYLAEQYQSQLILDCSQALYFIPKNNSCHVFYSPRKFVGLPDGGCLRTETRLDTVLEVDTSYNRMSHLLKRIDVGPEMSYEDFKTNDRSIENLPLMEMSYLTRRLLKSINFNHIAERRRSNYKVLQTMLPRASRFSSIAVSSLACPMYYLYESNDAALRQELIEQKIFVPLYWPNVVEASLPGSIEYYLATNLLPLPIDQRYSKEDMMRIVRTIHGS